MDATFNSKHSDIAFRLEKQYPKEPIEIVAHDYNGDPVKIETHDYESEDFKIERDLVCAGNPQVVSEDFKKLVEELDPEAAQFFETVIVNWKAKKKYYVMHVTKAIRCLDKSRSKFIGFRDLTVGMVNVNKIGENDHIFRLREEVQMHYVSERFYTEFKKRKLTGVIFNLRS